MQSKRKLLDIKGFSELKVDKVKEAAQKCVPGVSGFITAYELQENQRNIYTISTGCKAFDGMLGGQVNCNSSVIVVLSDVVILVAFIAVLYVRSMENIVSCMIDLVGGHLIQISGCGKTQLVQTMCVTAQVSRLPPLYDLI